MLLVQYNDNILAMFGFPLVIPHQKGGGRRREQLGEHIVTGKVWLFLSFSLSLPFSLHWSSLVRPGVNYKPSCCQYSCVKAHNHGLFSICVTTVDVMSLHSFFNQFGKGMRQITAANLIIPQAKHFTERQTENTEVICQNGSRTDRPTSQGQI